MVAKALAQNLRYFRRVRSLTQAELSKMAEVPRSTMAHLESGSGNPSLQTLCRVAGALQIGVDELIAQARSNAALVKCAQVPVELRVDGAVRISKLLPVPVPGMEMDKIELAPGVRMRGVPHLPRTRETFTVLRGRIALYVCGETFEVEAGDVLSFPGDQSHSYHNWGGDVAVGMSIVVFDHAG